MQSCCFGFEQHRGRWAVFSAVFHHAERAPRVISSLTAESPTIRSFKTSLVSIQGFSPPVSCAQGRLVNSNKVDSCHLVVEVLNSRSFKNGRRTRRTRQRGDGFEEESNAFAQPLCCTGGTV